MCSRGQCYRPAPLVAATVSASMRSPQQRTRRYAQSVGGTTPHPAEAVPSSHPPDSPHAVGEPAKQATTTTESQDQYTSRRGHPTRPRARQRKELRWFVSTVSAFDVPNLESRLLNRPEGEHDDWCAFLLQFSSQTSQTAAPSPSAKHSNCDMSSISWSPTLSCFDGFDFSMGYHVQCETQSECPSTRAFSTSPRPLGLGFHTISYSV